MNLLLLDQFSDLGGAQQNLLELLPEIRKMGWPTLVGLPGDGELFQRVRGMGFEAERIACGPYESGRKSPADAARFLAGTPLLARQIRRMARRAEAGLVYLNGPRLLPAAALAQTGLPVVFHSHSYLAPGAVRRLASLALGTMDAWVIAQCEFVAAPWRAAVRPGRACVIYNGVPGPGRTPVLKWSGSPVAPPRVGCIGRIAPEKGQREFVAAAKVIHQAIPDCRFVIYGAPLFGDGGAESYAAQVRAEAKGLPLEFAGWVNNIQGCLAQLDLLLVPSAAHEATTRVILEAFASGVPVVAYPSGGIPEVLEDGVTGLLAKNARDMAEGAIDLLTGDARRLISLAQAGRETWSRRFTPERYHRQVLRALEAATGPLAFSATD